MIKFVIGNVGNNNVDSWVYFRAGLFRCIVLGGGVDGRATTMMTTSGGAGDTTAILSNIQRGILPPLDQLYSAYTFMPSSSSSSLASLRFC
jgi:hypothetical protein